MTMIVSAVYGPDAQTAIVTFDDGRVCWVPNDTGNAQKQELLAWVAAGNTIAPYVAPPPTPNQLRVAAIKADAAYIDLFNRARTASASDIDAWFTANVTTLTQARSVLAAIVKLLAASY